MARGSANGGNGGGCVAALGVLIVLALVLAALSTVGHVLGLTPTYGELTDKPDGWVSAHYRGVVWGYVLTVLVIISVAAVVWLLVRVSSAVPGVSEGARHALPRVGAALAVLLFAIVVLPIGKRVGVSDVDRAASEVSSSSGNVPDVVGKSAANAENALSEADLETDYAQYPREDQRCRVVAQRPAAGSTVEEFSSIRLRCVVKVPDVVGRKAYSAQDRLDAVGLDSELLSEPEDYDTDRCRVKRQSRTGDVAPNATVRLRLACSQPPPPEPIVEQSPSCDPNYSPCIPPYPPDLDCADTGPVTVIGPSDPHGLDADGDGYGCEA